MGDAVGLSGSLLHQLTPFLHERLEFAGRFGIRLQGPPPAAIKRQQIQQEVRIARIILAAGRIHGLAVIGTGGGVHGVQRQMLVFAQGVQKRATRLLHRDARARSGEPFGPLQGPGLNGLGRMPQGSLLALRVARFLDNPGVLAVGPVDGDPCCEIRLLRRKRFRPCSSPIINFAVTQWEAARAFAKRLYVASEARHDLSIR